MNEHTTDELLSAFVDDELTGEQQVEVLERLMAEPKLRDKWGRYHAISHVMDRGEVDLRGANGLADRVREQLTVQPIEFKRRVVGNRRTHLRWMRPVAGLALAATVATVAILTVRSANQSRTLGVETVAQIGTPLRWDVSQPAVEARLNRYLVNHSEYMNRGMYGMHPYARIVGYQTR